MPKTLNALYSMIPLVDKNSLAYVKKSDWEANTSARGWEYAALTHGKDWAGSFKEASAYAPDLGEHKISSQKWVKLTILAHITMEVSMQNLLSDYSVHDGIATMALLVTVLVTMNCPIQASWHAKGYIRHGGKKEDLHDIVEFAKKIANVTGNELPADFPSLESMLSGM